MFDPEAEVWYGIPEFDILGLNITVPGFSPLFPDAHCTANGDVCQLVTGESGECGHFEYLAVRRQC
jgi:purine nucleoside permease